MAAREIVNNVFSVGTINWNLRNFDALMQTPRGTSYNSYLIKGSEKTALVDTCEPHDDADFITNILRVLPNQPLDYIVSVHAEQDHSGLIPLLLELYQSAKVVTNEVCKDLLIEMHNLQDQEDRFIVVDEGQTISLGDKTLKFHPAPWVHWPDTMFAELVEDKIVFTSDFLGTHYAGETLFQNDDSPDYLEAAKRYYSAIMMPFRASVQEHLKYIDEIAPDYICPSHGPVLKMPAKVVELYRRWSDDKPDNSVVVGYVSMHGSTELMVKSLVDDLVQRGIPVHQYNLLETDTGVIGSAIVDAATIILAAPTVLFGPHPIAVNTAYLVRILRPKTKYLGVIGSYGWGTNAVNYLADMLSPLGAEFLEPVYIKGLPDEDTVDKIHKLADDIAEKHSHL